MTYNSGEVCNDAGPGIGKPHRPHPTLMQGLEYIGKPHRLHPTLR